MNERLWRVFLRDKSTRKVTPCDFSSDRDTAQKEADGMAHHFGDATEFWIQPDTDDVFQRLMLEKLERIAKALEKIENP